MTDEEFLHAFFSLTLPPAAFRHRDHLRLAWLVARRHGAGPAARIIAAGIRRFAEANGHGGAYHETLTRFWVSIVAHAAAQHAGIEDFDRFVEVHPMLLDGGLPLRHWSREALFDAGARAGWRAPDVLPLPF